MKCRSFTKLICAGMASGCVFMAAGQEKATEVRITDRDAFLENRSELRADNVEWWPDSVITYNYLGEPTFKEYYYKEKRTMTYASPDSNWELWDERNSNGYSFFLLNAIIEMDHYSNNEEGFWLRIYRIFTFNAPVYPKHTYSCNTVYDDKNNLILAEFTKKGESSVFHTYRMKYNEENNLVWAEYYSYDRLFDRHVYEYNKNGDPEYCKQYNYNWISDSMEMTNIHRVKYDEEGRPIEGYNLYLNSGENSDYRVFYYSDSANTPDIEIENNTSVGSNNQGSFDLNINVPADSIQNGSLVVQLPEGFTLDEENTSLTIDFAGLFDLTITKQENNSWLLEIKPKTSRSTPLRADEIQKAIQVAYRVDEEAKRGSYDISVNSILFTTPGGDLIPEPAITVPAVLNRWGVANEAIEGNNVWVSGRTLYVRTNESCPVSVYAVGGQVIIQQTVSAGETAIPLPQGIYFIKAGDTSKKVMVR